MANNYTVYDPSVPDKVSIGLGNVDNTSDSTKNSAAATLANKTLTSPKVTAYDGIYNGTAKALEIGSYGTPVNLLGVEAAPSGANVTLYASGSDTDIGINILAKGAGRVKAGGVNVPTISSADTLTNKRIDPRTSTTTSATSLTPDVSAYDQYVYTALAAGLTINAPTGTPVQGTRLLFRIKDNGTSRTLTWNAIYRAIGVVVPAATTISKTVYVGCIYNADDTKWDVISVNTEA